ncbi:MAG TPA: pyrroline-5-carboxylate reductase [Chitinophagales bacterium]
MHLTIIGGGNLGSAIARGVTEKKLFSSITVTRRNLTPIKALSALGINVESDNTKAVSDADIIILAVKPHQIKAIAEEIAPHLKNALLISVITGISIADLDSYFGVGKRIVRAMPNTAIAQAESLTCIAFNEHSTSADKDITLKLFSALGEAVFIEEKLMDAATVLGASGIAFVMRFIRAMMQGGIQIGFDSKTALAIVTQTVKGAAVTLQNENSHPENEIDKVTTPQGCTIAGLNEMELQGFSSALIKGINTSYHAIDAMKKK